MRFFLLSPVIADLRHERKHLSSGKQIAPIMSDFLVRDGFVPGCAGTCDGSICCKVLIINIYDGVTAHTGGEGVGEE